MFNVTFNILFYFLKSLFILNLNIILYIFNNINKFINLRFII